LALSLKLQEGGKEERISYSSTWLPSFDPENQLRKNKAELAKPKKARKTISSFCGTVFKKRMVGRVGIHVISWQAASGSFAWLPAALFHFRLSIRKRNA
jgi:hypothetical protein